MATTEQQPPLPPQPSAAAGTTTTTATSSSTTQSASGPASALAGTTCIELALEGERLCKAGDPKNGIRFFEEARKVGTADTHTLSAIYSQLGNAYFALGDYQKALECHKMDVEITQKVNDEVAEAKACGNLGNVYKMFGKFDEAAVYCRRYLNICQKLNDREGEARALYNLANVYHTQGKRLISSCDQEFGELSRDIKSSLERAVEYYERTLKVVTELSDFTTMGKSYGNLGNTHYLLGNFSLAVEFHRKRLELAQSIQDKLGERRALLNLGNANVFMGDFQGAIESYSATLKMAQEFGDKNTEAHACYSLANSYTFLRDYKSAVKYHLKYLELIKDMDDKLGEGRAYWSLVNLHLMLHNPEKALVFAKKHHEVAELLNDKAGLASAKLNIQELEDILAQKKSVPTTVRSSTIFRENDEENLHEIDSEAAVSSSRDQVSSDRDQQFATNSKKYISKIQIPQQPQLQQQQQHHPLRKQHSTQYQQATDPSSSSCPSCNDHQNTHLTDNMNTFRLTLDKRQEQEQRRFKKQLNINLTGDVDGLNARRRARQQQETHHHHHHHREHPRGGPVRSSSSERLFDMIAHFQSGRIDDQRCEISKRPNVINGNPRGIQGLLSSSKRKPTGSSSSHNDKENNNFTSSLDDDNIDKSSSQRTGSATSNPLSAAASVLKATYRKASLVAYPSSSSGSSNNSSNLDQQHRSSIANPQHHRHHRRPTVTAEHQDQLFDLIAGAQRQRMDEQRASLPTISLLNGPGANRTVNAILPTPKRNNQQQQINRHMPSTYGQPQNERIIPATKTISSGCQDQVSDESSHDQFDDQAPQRSIVGREKSNSIVVPAQFRDNPTTSSSDNAAIRYSSDSLNKQSKPITRQFQTFDHGTSAYNTKQTGHVRDDAKFLDNLMKYQSTRFNDQRSEFPRKNSSSINSSHESSNEKDDGSQADNFFNLIVRFQSDRIEDQRSAPP